MKQVISFAVIALFMMLTLIACSPSESSVQTAIAETAEAGPTDTATPKSTSTPRPTATVKRLPTLTPSPIPSETPIPCSVFVSGYVADIRSDMLLWDDSEELASGTGRIALSGPISSMQEARRGIKVSTPPPCAESIKDALLLKMDWTLQAYLTFQAGGGEEDMLFDFMMSDIADEHLDHLFSFEGIDPVERASLVTYVVDGELRNAFVSYTDITGNLTEEELEEVPWIHSITVDPGTKIEVVAKSEYGTRYAQVKCFIVNNGEVVAFEDEMDAQASVTCSSFAK